MSAPEQLARKFHETYERLSPAFGYTTRQETRQFDPTSPNGKLMIAVCEAMRADLAAADADAEAHEKEIAIWAENYAALERKLAEAREVKPHHAEILAKEMQAIVAADRWKGRDLRWKGRDLSAAPPEKWSHLRPETRQFWIDTAARILSALKDPKP